MNLSTQIKEINGKERIKSAINNLSAQDIPFFFMIDYSGEKGIVENLGNLKESNISGSVNGMTFGRKPEQNTKADSREIRSIPVPFKEYSKGFANVQNHIKRGNTYLLNLTFRSELKGNISLSEIYKNSDSPFKLLWEDRLVFFSPEPFIKIKEGKIYSFPMKGTIDASLPNAKEELLNNHKELCEHYTIVDLIRNDLSTCATKINVDKFRYIDKIETSHGPILQSSSCISGTLIDNPKGELGTILYKMLPAGSITGAPKAKTLQIIKESETTPRGYYTGIMGISSGNSIEAGVIIRYIEKDGEKYYYRSGGGITTNSNLEEEYKELIDKIYTRSISPENH